MKKTDQAGYSDYKAYLERKTARSERAKRAAATRALRKKMLNDLIAEAVRRNGPVILPVTGQLKTSHEWAE